MRYIRWTLPIVVVLALITTGVIYYSTQHQKPVQSAVLTPQAPLDANKILELVNIERAKVNVAPLVMDTGLIATAQSRADDMVARNYFSHYDPVTGESLIKIKPTNPQCIYASENLISVDDIGEKNTDAIRWWLNSPAHKEAMLDPKYTLTGVATNGDIGVQHFCQTN